MATAAPAGGRKTRKGRLAGRPSTNFNSSNFIADSILSARIQFLVARYGLVASHATVIAALAFGGRP